MNYLKLLHIYFCFVLTTASFADEIAIQYRLMNQETFEKTVVGNTIIGMTRQSQSLYMLYFLADGSCELWKQQQIYAGHWWIEQDELNRDFVRAFWPAYFSSEPKSLFSPENPRYGTATSIRYYYDSKSNAILLSGKTIQTPALLVPGRAFPYR